MAKSLKAPLKLLLVGLIVLCGSVKSSFSQRQIDPEVERKINDYINDIYLPLAGVSTLGLAIVGGDGQLLYTNGYGLADVEKEIYNSNQTQYNIGSVSKSFTVTALIKVLHETFPDLGESVLDTPINKLLPQFNLTLIDRFRTESATVRDLLAHRLCIFRDDFQLMADPFDTAQEVLYRERYAEPICGIRTEFQYNNQLYIVAGQVLSLLTNKTYEEAVYDLFREIGMLNSTFSFRSDDYSNMPYRAQPYYIMDGIVHPMNTDLIKRVTPSNAAGGLFVPPNDMARYMKFHLNLGQIDGKQVIPEEVMKWMGKASSHYGPQPIVWNGLLYNTFSYGMGLFIATFDKSTYFHHGGYFPPYRSLMSLFPEENIGIFTSGNEGPVNVDPVVLHAIIFETLRGTENATEKIAGLGEILKHKEVEKKHQVKAELKTFLQESKTLAGGRQLRAEEIVGEYGHGSSGDVQIVEKWDDEKNETGLFVTYGPKWIHGWLEPVAVNTYKVRLVTDVDQDDFSGGIKETSTHVRVYNETLEFIAIVGEIEILRSKFTLGVTLDKLPPIPWLPGSCGSE